MSKLSPQAQAVLTALNTAPAHTRLMAAAALRAAADQVVPITKPFHHGPAATRLAAEIRADLLAIAAELEAGGKPATNEYPVAGRDPCDCKGIAGDNGVCDDMCRRAGLR